MDTGSGSSVFIQLIIIIILTMFNAFFSGVEMAIVSVNRNKLKILVEKGDKKAIMLEKILEEPSKFLSTIQIGITLAGFLASASAATGLAKYLAVFLSYFGIGYSEQISMLLMTLLLSYVTLVFGELIPKRVALQYSEEISLFSIGIINAIAFLFSPFVKILTISTNVILNLLKMNDENLEQKVSKEEIRSLVEVGREHGIINDVEKVMIENIIEFDEKVVREIMIPRTRAFLIEKSTPLKELLKKDEFPRFSRIPVYDKEPDNIVGVIYTKELLYAIYKKGIDKVKLTDMLNEVYFVPETKNVNELFNDMKNNKKHIAVLIDEYGGFSGIVTLEDLIEEVMGNIYDESDLHDYDIKKMSNNRYLLRGDLTLNDINNYFDISLYSKHYDTLSGLLIEQLGYIPEEKESIDPILINGISFKPLSIHNKKIERVLMVLDDSLSV